MKRKIDVFAHAETILRELQRGILVTAKSGDKVNPMTIAWGTLGIEWGKVLFTVFVRESRFTKQLLDENPDITLEDMINQVIDRAEEVLNQTPEMLPVLKEAARTVGVISFSSRSTLVKPRRS